jgi:hypothetical protein
MCTAAWVFLTQFPQQPSTFRWFRLQSMFRMLLSAMFCGAAALPAHADTPTLEEIRDRFLASLKIFENFEATGTVRYFGPPDDVDATARVETEFVRFHGKELLIENHFSDDDATHFVEWTAFDGKSTRSLFRILKHNDDRPVIPHGGLSRERLPFMISALGPELLVAQVGGEQSLPSLWQTAPVTFVGSEPGLEGAVLLHLRFGPVQKPVKKFTFEVVVDAWFSLAHGMLPQRRVETFSAVGTEHRSQTERRITAFRALTVDGVGYFVPERGEEVSPQGHGKTFELSRFDVITSVPDSRFIPEYPQGIRVIERLPDGRVADSFPGPGGQAEWMKLAKEEDAYIKARLGDIQAPLEPIPATEPLPRAPGSAVDASPSRTGQFWWITLAAFSAAMLGAGVWLRRRGL